MSLEAMRAVQDLPPGQLTSSQRFVLLQLASYADKQGQNAWPSVETLAGRTDLSARTVRRALRELEDMRLIHPEQRRRHKCHIYALNFERLVSLIKPKSPDGKADTVSPKADTVSTESGHCDPHEGMRNKTPARTPARTSARTPAQGRGRASGDEAYARYAQRAKWAQGRRGQGP